VAGASVDPAETLETACEHARLELARSVRAEVVSASYVQTWANSQAWDVKNAGTSLPGLVESVKSSADVRATWTDPRTGEGYCLASVARADTPARDPCAVAGIDFSNGQAQGPARTPHWHAENESEIANRKSQIGSPPWLTTLPSSPDATFAVGASPAYTYRSNALEYAAREALGALARTIDVRVSGVAATVRTLVGAGFQLDRVTSTHVWLDGARMVAWWADRESNRTYVLYCLPSAGVKVQLLSGAAEFMARPEASAAAGRPEESHKEQLDRLRTLLDEEL